MSEYITEETTPRIDSIIQSTYMNNHIIHREREEERKGEIQGKREDYTIEPTQYNKLLTFSHYCSSPSESESLNSCCSISAVVVAPPPPTVV